MRSAIRGVLIGSVLILLSVAAVGQSQAGGHFQLIGKYRGVGSVLSSVVARDKVYVSYDTKRGTPGIVVADPQTGGSEFVPSPTPSEAQTWAMVEGSDGNIYTGTCRSAHLMMLDVHRRRLTDLGRPAPEACIWDLALGSDGKIYGGTYPHAKLVRYDPSTGSVEDLGRLDPKEEYARWLAASKDGFIYAGIGMSRMNIAAYEIKSGTHREILPEQYQTIGVVTLFRGMDGNVYAKAGGQYFRLSGWSAEPTNEVSPARELRNLSDGRRIAVRGATLEIVDTKRAVTERHPIAVPSEELPLFRLGPGPDGEVYASTSMPIHFIRVDDRNGIVELGELGSGEVYSFLPWKNYILMAAYGGTAPLMAFDVLRGVEAGNPQFVKISSTVSGTGPAWRPAAMIAGADGNVWVGAVPGYGSLDGTLTRWNVASGVAQQFDHIVANESIVTLATWEHRILGGTRVTGGGGSHAIETSARLFVWNPQTTRTEFETVPVPGAAALTDFLTLPSGEVFGVAGRVFFLFDPKSRSITKRGQLPLHSDVIRNSVAVGPDRRIWGLADEGIFAMDPKTGKADVIPAPEKITGGFAMRGDNIYYISGPAVYRYSIQ